jgi:Domain of unknown function DUF29
MEAWAAEAMAGDPADGKVDLTAHGPQEEEMAPEHQEASGRVPLVDYETDFYAWAQAQAAALRAKDWAALDLHHLIEEVEDLAGRHRDALGSELKRLLVHLLKWHYQPTHRSDGWLDTMEQARQAIDEVIEDYPSLAGYLPVVLPKAYQRARRQAARETRLPLATFPPEGCPWALDDLRREGWLPPDAGP